MAINTISANENVPGTINKFQVLTYLSRFILSCSTLSSLPWRIVIAIARHTERPLFAARFSNELWDKQAPLTCRWHKRSVHYARVKWREMIFAWLASGCVYAKLSPHISEMCNWFDFKLTRSLASVITHLNVGKILCGKYNESRTSNGTEVRKLANRLGNLKNSCLSTEFSVTWRLERL